MCRRLVKPPFLAGHSLPGRPKRSPDFDEIAAAQTGGKEGPTGSEKPKVPEMKLKFIDGEPKKKEKSEIPAKKR